MCFTTIDLCMSLFIFFNLAFLILLLYKYITINDCVLQPLIFVQLFLFFFNLGFLILLLYKYITINHISCVGVRAQIGILGLGPYSKTWIRQRRSKWLVKAQSVESHKEKMKGYRRKERKRIIVALRVVLALKINCSNNNSPTRTFSSSSFICVFLCLFIF